MEEKKKELEEQEDNNISLYSAIMLVIMLLSWITKFCSIAVIGFTLPIPLYVLDIVGAISTIETLLTVGIDKYKGIIPFIPGKNKMVTLKREKEIFFRRTEEKKKYKKFLYNKYYGKYDEKKVHPIRDTRETIRKMNHTGVDEYIYALHGGVALIESIISYPFILIKNIIKQARKSIKFNNSIRFVDRSIDEEVDGKVINHEPIQVDEQSVESVINESLLNARNSREAYTVYLNRENPIKEALAALIHTKWSALSVDDEDRRDKYLNKINDICDFLTRSLNLSGSRLEEASEYIIEQLKSLEREIDVVLPPETAQSVMYETHQLNGYGNFNQKLIKKA